MGCFYEGDFDVQEVGNLEINMVRLSILSLEALQPLVLELESLRLWPPFSLIICSPFSPL